MASFCKTMTFNIASMVSMLLCVFLSSSLSLVPVNSEVVSLTDDNFEQQTKAATGQTNGKWFVNFYSPWCYKQRSPLYPNGQDCKDIGPTWTALASTMETNHSNEDIHIGSVKCHGDHWDTLCKRFNIIKYDVPDLKYFANGKMYTVDNSLSVEELETYIVSSYQNDDNGKIVPNPQKWYAKLYHKYSKKLHQQYSRKMRDLKWKLQHLKWNWQRTKIDDGVIIATIWAIVAGVLVIVGIREKEAQYEKEEEQQANNNHKEEECNKED